MRSARFVVVVILALISTCAGPQVRRRAPVGLAEVELGSVHHGFRAAAVYVNGQDAPVGARFVHARTGFVLDLLQMETAPQAFLWVNTPPTSDKGEPHTQEHLLLGKGQRGRYVSGQEEMSLGRSSAFTMQWRTCYHYHTTAGVDVFWDLTEAKLDAMLHPDYTDEEIRREVRNFRVADNADGSLRLEETGTVYNEMVRGFESPVNGLYRWLGQALWGADHPLALSAGGLPEAIREMTPQDIRTFHRDAYHLGNIGMIAVLSRANGVAAALKRADAIFARVQGAAETSGRNRTTEADLPPPRSSKPPGEIAVVRYPHGDEQRPGRISFAWPADRDLSVRELMLLRLFLDSIAGDSDTPLYKRFVDSATRARDLGATGISAAVDQAPGYPVWMVLRGVAAEHLSRDGLEAVRAQVSAEIARIAQLPDTAPELIAIHDRMRARMVEMRRRLSNWLDTPPGFGIRGRGPELMEHFRLLAKTGEVRRSFVLAPELAWVEQQIVADRNQWKDRLTLWRVLGVAPYAAANRASAELLAENRAGKRARIEAEIARLQEQYGTETVDSTLRRYRADHDKQTADLDRLEAEVGLPGFLADPPMTLDESLRYEEIDLDRIPLVVSRVDNMTGASVGLALRADLLSEAQLAILPALPELLTNVGLYWDGKAIDDGTVRNRLRREVLRVGISIATNPATGRVELIGTASGHDPAEAEVALQWLTRFLHHPDWRPENLPRMRDVIDRAAKAHRKIMEGSEERWVKNPAEAIAYQTDLPLAHARSVFTRAHDLHRMRWLLRDAGSDDEAEAIAVFLSELSVAGSMAMRTDLEALTRFLARSAEGAAGELSVLSEELRPHGSRFLQLPDLAAQLARDAAEDLAAMLGDLPDSYLHQDWSYLCRQMLADLLTPQDEVLASLHEVRRALLRRWGTRLVMVGPSAIHERLRLRLAKLVADFGSEPPQGQRATSEPFVFSRLLDREPAAESPEFVGLVNRNTQSGAFAHLVAAPNYAARTDDEIFDYLSSNLYTGHGAHSIFMKTWSAGLAYSNGLRIDLRSGRLLYYAERCPLLPQTMRFVVDQLNDTRPDDRLVEYALAQAFKSRGAESYESRGWAIANDLVDEITPDRVRAFRRKLLALRRRGDLTEQLFSRMEKVYGRVLPGYGTSSAEVNDAVYFVVGPEAQLAAWEEYLRAAEDSEAQLHRLYPRDFWRVRTFDYIPE